MGNSNEAAKKLTGAAGIIMFATFLSRITGFLRTLLITTNMLPKGYSDEFLLAFTLPDLVYDLLAGGAIAAALIPILSSFIAKNKENIGWKAVSTFMNLSVIFMIVLEVVFFIFTDDLLGLLAAGYNEGSSGNKELLVKLTRILLLSAPFMMMAGQFNGILNSYKRFAVASFGPVIYNLCTILSIAVFGAKSAELTAWGVVIGAAIFFIIQLAGTMRHLTMYKPKLYLKSPAFRQLLALAVPSLLSSTIIEINIIISRGYATYLDQGMVTLLNSANRTWQLPLGIFAQSIGIALLPTLSEHYAAGNHSEFKGVLYKGLRVVFLLSLPTSLIMMILNQDIMRVLFKWGSFSEYQVFFGGISLLAYSAALVFASMVALVTRAFYAVQDSKTPLICGLFGILANYLFNSFFRAYTGIGIAGPALSYAIASFVNMMLLFITYYKKTGVDIISENFFYIVKVGVAVIPSGLLTYALSLLVRPDINSKISQILALCVPLAAGIGFFCFILVKLKIPEIAVVTKMVLSRLKRS